MQNRIQAEHIKFEFLDKLSKLDGAYSNEPALHELLNTELFRINDEISEEENFHELNYAVAKQIVSQFKQMYMYMRLENKLLILNLINTALQHNIFSREEVEEEINKNEVQKEVNKNSSFTKAISNFFNKTKNKNELAINNNNNNNNNFAPAKNKARQELTNFKNKFLLKLQHRKISFSEGTKETDGLGSKHYTDKHKDKKIIEKYRELLDQKYTL